VSLAIGSLRAVTAFATWVAATGGAGGGITTAARAAAAAAKATASAAPSQAWEPVAPGAERMTAELEGGGQLLLLRFDLDYFRAEVVVGKGPRPQPRTATDLRQGRGAVAAVNGGFFDERAVPLGLRVAGGEERFPLRPKADWGVLILAGHRAHVVHTHDYPLRPAPPPVGAAAPAASPAVDGAIQVGPRLLVEGQPLKLRAQLARRTAVALDREGRTITLVVAPLPVEANELASRLAALGFDAAILLDGGPSTQLSLELGDARAEIGGAYPVPDLLAIFPRSPSRRNSASARPSSAPSTSSPQHP
jgi:uncharacterized protein YigE (DUF2233 family)